MNDEHEHEHEVQAPADEVHEDPAALDDDEGVQAPADEHEVQDDDEVQAPADEDPAADDEVIPGVYVEELRGRLFTALVAADGRLADPTDMPYSADLVDDPAALEAAITARLDANPRLGKHAATGDVGAGARGESVDSGTDIIELIRRAQGH